MDKPFLIISSLPKSGITVFNQCLSLIGMTRLDEKARISASTIHQLLLQDLEFSPTMAGPLPANWTGTNAFQKAKKRCLELLEITENSVSSHFLADPLFARFMPLWNEVIHESSLTNKLIILLRHPWETALSLSKTENIGIDQAHLLWLSHVRDALKACREHPCSLITFDQLLADPISLLAEISTELDLLWPVDPLTVSTPILDFIQPGLKNHHLSGFSKKDKQRYAAYDRLYQNIRRDQQSRKFGTPPSPDNFLAESGLVETLLTTIAQYQKREIHLKTKHQGISVYSKPALFAEIRFPTGKESGEKAESISLIPDNWQEIVFAAPGTSFLHHKSITVKPLNTNGFVRISSIRLNDKTTGTNIWKAKSSKEFDRLTFKGSVVRLPHHDELNLLVTGNNPELVLPKQDEMSDRPVELRLWIKASRNQENLNKHFVDRSLLCNYSFTKTLTDNKNDFGILVIGYMRPKHLQSVLESLDKQDALSLTNVWLDGTAGLSELDQKNNYECITVAQNFPVKSIRTHYGHQGVQKIIIDGLTFITGTYETFMVLEDDCFPCSSAVDTFRSELQRIKNAPSIFSVYGHHFETETEKDTISRFQGWGWGTTSEKMSAVLPELIKFNNMSENDYLVYVNQALTKDIRQRLNVTPGRDAITVLKNFFSWDESLALITAQRNFRHKKTPEKTVYNFGLDSGTGHFTHNFEKFRKPPFNMITIDEVWDYF